MSVRAASLLMLAHLPSCLALSSVGWIRAARPSPSVWGRRVSAPHSVSEQNKILTTSSSALLMSGSSGAAAAGEGSKRVLVPIADGSEEIESVTIIDTLVRAGAAVTVASVGSNLQVTCSRGVKLVADCSIDQCENEKWDAVVCPGGMPGATHLKESTVLKSILRTQSSEENIVAAICAAPAVVLASHGLLDKKKATCYPADAFTSQIPSLSDEKVTVDGNVVTSKGPATAMLFALQLVESLFGAAKREEIGKALLVTP